MKRSTKILILFVWTLPLVFFQNCGPAMHSAEGSLSSSGIYDAKSFRCDAGADPSVISTKRLSKVEIQRTYETLLSKFASGDRTAIRNAIAPFFINIPDDNVQKFESDDSALNPEHVSAYLALARKFAAEVFLSSARYRAFIGTCATATPLTSACLDTFLTTGATKIFRRPLKSAEITAIKTEYAAYTERHSEWLIVRLLMNPNFIYHLELEGLDEKPKVLKLSPYELASRISFYLLKMGPDDALLAAAADGSILTQAKIESEVARLTATYPAYYADSVDRFYAGWLSYQNIAFPLVPSNPMEAAFVAGATVARGSLVNEIKEMTKYFHNTGAGNFDDLFTSDRSFAVDDDLAALYGVTKWDGTKDHIVRFPAGERAGLLGRAGFLMSGNSTTNPIIRGLMVRRQFLCDDIPEPPDNIASMLRDPDPDPNASTRQRYHAKTSGSACMGCHAMINPLGFALENFDAFGRYRQSEKVYGTTGALLNQIPVDPVVQPALTASDTRVTRSPAEFSQAMVDTGRARQCMVQSFYQFAYHKKPDVRADGCALVDIDSQAKSPAGLSKMFLNAPLSASFQRRKLD